MKKLYCYILLLCFPLFNFFCTTVPETNQVADGNFEIREQRLIDSIKTMSSEIALLKTNLTKSPDSLIQNQYKILELTERFNSTKSYVYSQYQSEANKNITSAIVVGSLGILCTVGLLLLASAKNKKANFAFYTPLVAGVIIAIPLAITGGKKLDKAKMIYEIK